MNNRMQNVDCRELTDAELEAVSGGDIVSLGKSIVVEVGVMFGSSGTSGDYVAVSPKRMYDIK